MLMLSQYHRYHKTHIACARNQTYFDPDSLLHQSKKVMSSLQQVLFYYLCSIYGLLLLPVTGYTCLCLYWTDTGVMWNRK